MIDYTEVPTARLLPALLALLLVAPALSAATVTWQFAGQLTAVDTSDGLLPEFSGSTVGDRFLAAFTFETSSVPSRGVPGTYGGMRYDYYDALLSAELMLGTNTLEREPAGYAQADSIVIRDNYADDRNGASFPVDQPLDGISMVWSVVPEGPVQSDQDGAQFRVLLRGSILDLFAGPGLPAEPDPRLLDLELIQFDLLATRCSPTTPGSFNCVDDTLLGSVDSITVVPAPSGAWLFTTGLLGLGWRMSSTCRSIATK